MFFSVSKNRSSMDTLKIDFSLVDSNGFTNESGRVFDSPFGDCYDYHKHSNGVGIKITGHSLYVNCSRYAIVDIDIHAPELEAIGIRDLFCAALEEEKVKIIKTRGGGLHIYSLWDESLPMKSGRETNIYNSLDGYSVDVFSPVNPKKASIIILPGSEAKGSDGKIGRYEWIRKCDDSELSPFSAVVKALEEVELVSFEKLRGTEKKEEPKIEIKEMIPEPEPMEEESDEKKNKHENTCSKELFELLKEGIDGIPQIGDWSDDWKNTVAQEPTLNMLFNGAYGCVGDEVSMEEVEEWLNSLKKVRARFTESAYSQFNTMRASCRSRKDNWKFPIIISMIKYHNPEFWETTMKEYYRNSIAEKLRNEQIDIDFSDPFDFDAFRVKYEKGEYILTNNETHERYINNTEFLRDLRRVMCVVAGESQLIYVLKRTDSKYGLVARCQNHINTRNELDLTKIGVVRIVDGKLKSKLESIWDAFDNLLNKSAMFKSDIRFVSDSPKSFSYFKGFERKLNVVRTERIRSQLNKFYDNLRNNLCNNDETSYNYVLNWVARRIQHPELKNGTALVFFGEQGTGKNRFTDIICHMVGKYAKGNITKLEDITGNFNSQIERCMFIVGNEMSSVSITKYLNSNAFKALITEDVYMLNEKFLPVREADNLCDFIFLSNHPDPVKIENGDRRYAVFQVNSEHKDDYDYFEEIFKENLSEEFYDCLFEDFMNRDLTGFRVRDIPMTESKNAVIESCENSVQSFVRSEYEAFCNGYVYGRNCEILYASYVSFCQQSNRSPFAAPTFILLIEQLCEKRYKNIRRDGALKRTKQMAYFLKESLKERFKRDWTMTGDEIECSDEEEEE